MNEPIREPTQPSYYDNMLPSKIPEDSRYELIIDDIIEDFKMSLLGMRYDSNNGVYVAEGEPLLNGKGVNAIMGIVKSIVNRNTFLSNLTEEDVTNFATRGHRETAKLIFTNGYDFEVKKQNRSIICFEVGSFIYISLKRPLGEGERGYRKKVMSYIENVQKTDKQGFNIFGRGKNE